jgi:hypothetical protein
LAKLPRDISGRAIWYCYDPGTNSLVLLVYEKRSAIPLFFAPPRGHSRMVSLIVLLLALPLPVVGQGCPHEGVDRRLFGHVGCQIQRKLTIEHARPPRTIWSFHILKMSVKIDPKHPHLLMEWPARSQRLWRFRAGFRWDANAKAYIFPALALKKVDAPMAEYQQAPKPRPQTAITDVIPSLLPNPSN